MYPNREEYKSPQAYQFLTCYIQRNRQEKVYSTKTFETGFQEIREEADCKQVLMLRKFNYNERNKNLYCRFWKFYAPLYLFQKVFHRCLRWPILIKIYNYFPTFESVIRALKSYWSSFCNCSFLMLETTQRGSRYFLWLFIAIYSHFRSKAITF